MEGAEQCRQKEKTVHPERSHREKSVFRGFYGTMWASSPTISFYVFAWGRYPPTRKKTIHKLCIVSLVILA